MSLASTTYTLGAVVLIVLMAMRPPVEPDAQSKSTEPATQQATPDEAVSAPTSAPDQATDTPAALPTTDTEPTPAEENNPANPAPVDKSGAIDQPQPDYAREQRLASEISDMILDGEVIKLQASGHEFIALQTDADDARGAVIIAHGRGYHPDWVDIANPLRVGLAADGWTTLSLQMPVLAKEAKYNDYVPLFMRPAQGLLLA